MCKGNETAVTAQFCFGGISSGFTQYKMPGVRWGEEELNWNREQDLGHDSPSSPHTKKEGFHLIANGKPLKNSGQRSDVIRLML